MAFGSSVSSSFPFQSLIGRLKTHETLAARGQTGEFQSLIGRLKTSIFVKVALLPTIVSIPHR